MENITIVNENIKLIQNPNGLTFGTDAYLLSAFVSGGKNLHGADLGSGSGIIPLLCASRSKAEKIYAVEIQESFASLIGRNAELNDLGKVVIPICADVRNIRSADIGYELDFVTANPPYMKIDSGKRNRFDEKFIARHEVFGNVGDFCACASRLLKYGGRFYSVWRPDRLTDLLFALRENKLEPKVMTFVTATAESEPSMVLIRAVKGSASGTIVTKNLILHNSQEDAKQNVLSRNAEDIYELCSFERF